MKETQAVTIAMNLGLALLALFAPVHSIMISAFTLIMADLITGMLAARKRGEPIRSAGLQRSIVKVVVYEFAIIFGFIAQHFLMGDVIPVCNIIGTYVGIVELKSLYENIDGLAGGNLLKDIIEKLGSQNKD